MKFRNAHTIMLFGILVALLAALAAVSAPGQTKNAGGDKITVPLSDP